MARRPSRIAVIGLGNTLMGDDGVGVQVVEGLKPLVEGPVDCVTGETAGMALVGYFLEYDYVIVADAISAGSAPGAIFRFGPDEAGVMQLRSHNSHGMGISYLVTAARLKGADPKVRIFAVQVGDVSPRDHELSPQVARAVPQAVRFILSELGTISS